MIKKSFISVIPQKENEESRGSVEFQVFSFTTKIRRLTSHLELHKKDYSSQRGLRKILGKRQQLNYLSKKKYRTLQTINWFRQIRIRPRGLWQYY